MADWKTIDNLGVDLSSEYAKRQEGLDATILPESRRVAPQTEIDSISPSYVSETSSLMGIDQGNRPYSFFTRPPKYDEQRKRVFTHAIAPSLGSLEKREALLQRLQGVPATGKDLENKEILTRCLKTNTRLDDDLVRVEAMMNQFQKG